MSIQKITIELKGDKTQTTVREGAVVKLQAGLAEDAQASPARQDYEFEWSVIPDAGTIDPKTFTWDPGADQVEATWDTNGIAPGGYTVRLAATPNGASRGRTPRNGGIVVGELDLQVEPRALSRNDIFTVRLDRPPTAPTKDESLWLAIRASTNSIGFDSYRNFIDAIMCGETRGLADQDMSDALERRKEGRATPFPGADTYQLLKTATEVYLMITCGVLKDNEFDGFDVESYKGKHGRSLTESSLKRMWNDYLKAVNGTPNNPTKTLPYFALIRRKLRDVSLTASPADENQVSACLGILGRKVAQPCFLELIWSYWHEEAMLVQTLNAISIRFQNQRASDRDPLAQLDIDPLRPMNNLLWGYIQDEQHRLTLVRRAYEYDHHYGMSLQGKAVPPLRSADSRSKFLEAFHNLLHSALLFYRQDDDTTFKADGFPALNGLKEVHLLLAEGMHNQFGDLPFNARLEMLMQQWILARPEMREFIGGRTMMPYSEEWMDRVDAMKKLQGWTDVSVSYFNELARFGEQILLTIRYGSWNEVQDPNSAANWAREWRPEIKRYIHCYRAVTGVDLSPEVTDIRLAADRYLPPSVHLSKRLVEQRGGRAAAPSDLTPSERASNGTVSSAQSGQPAPARDNEVSIPHTPAFRSRRNQRKEVE